MIVTDRDLAELEQHLETVRKFDGTPDDLKGSSPLSPVFLANHPHIIIPLGFDEYRAISSDDAPTLTEEYGIERLSFDFAFESVYRQDSSGTWYWLEGLADERLHFVGPGRYSGNMEDDYNVPVSTWFDILNRIRQSPDTTPRKLWLPSLWTPLSQRQVRLSLSRTIPDLLLSIHYQERRLRDIPPRELEELVAELLRSRGMEIHLTPYSHDGGRDIIARGELVPGEPTTIAVEVKQKPVVGLYDLQRALNANQDFPALMIATAGRFSAGVVNEKRRERNNLRLILKDGVALSQWINVYAQHMQWLRDPK